MSHNALSRSMDRVPAWLVQLVVGILLTGSVTLVTWAVSNIGSQEARISVVETKADNIADDIKEIKDGQKETNHKLDRLIEKQAH